MIANKIDMNRTNREYRTMKRPTERNFYIKGSNTSSECVDKYHYIKALNEYIDFLEAQSKQSDSISHVIF